VAVLYLGMIVEQGALGRLFARPRHPYSVGLLSAVLLPNPKIKRQAQIKLSGEIPSPIDLPKACYLAEPLSAREDAAAASCRPSR
jgi:oligopeptide/dipeptide ABC transporter ATP-binding protein